MTRHTRGRGHGFRGRGGPDARQGHEAHREAHRAARHDHRRERRLRRRRGRGHGAVAVLLGVFGVLALLGGLALATLYALAKLLPYLLLGTAGVVAFLWARGRARRLRAPGAPEAPAEPSAETAERSWRRARADFQRVRGEYAAHETDPVAVLRRPALSDVAVPATARFVDAFAAAQALDTDGYPGEPHGASYVRSVETARRSWRAAVDAADRIRLTGLDAAERRTVERVLKLLTTARDSDSEPERLAAYARARSELDRLDRAGVVHLPRPARAHLDARARGALPGA